MERKANGPVWFRLALAGLLMSVMLGTATAETARPAPLRLNAFAVNLSGIGRAGAQQLDIVIERWSTDAEHKRVFDMLAEATPEKVLDTIQALKPRAGYIRTMTSLGWDIQYAREYPLPDGGRRIVFATDRPMTFYERANKPLSSEYEYMFCEIRLRKDGKGEGKLVTHAKISYDRDRDELEVENYAIEPVRLTRVEVQK